MQAKLLSIENIRRDKRHERTMKMQESLMTRLLDIMDRKSKRKRSPSPESSEEEEEEAEATPDKPKRARGRGRGRGRK